MHRWLAVFILAVSGASSARAASVVDGTWTGSADGQFNEARFWPDGSYVFVTQYAGGQTIRTWGSYSVTSTDSRHNDLSLKPDGWTPKTICKEVGRANGCHRLEIRAEHIPLAITSATTMDFGGDGDAIDDADTATIFTRVKDDPSLRPGAPPGTPAGGTGAPSAPHPVRLP